MTNREPAPGLRPPCGQPRHEAEAAVCPPHSPEALLHALRTSEARWRALLENTHDWVWEVNAEGRYTYSSPRVREMLGYTPEEVIGKTPFDFMPADEQARVSKFFLSALSQRAPFQGLENTNIRKDGSLVVLETNGAPFFDERGELAGYRGIDRDITARKQLEAELRRKSEQMEAMFATTHVEIALLDAEFNFLRVNRAYATVAGRDEAWFIGRNHFELFPHEENERLFRRVVESGEPFAIIAKPFAFPDRPELGITYWDWTLTPIKSESGHVESLVLTLVDVSERERQRLAAEAAYREAQAQLEQRVSERTAELEAANRELEAFSSAVSHDLRAPLRAIKGFTKILQEDCAKQMDEAGHLYLDRIHQASLHMSDFIDSLLVLSLIFRTELHKQPVDLSAIAHDFIAELCDQEPARHVDVHIEPGLCAIGDPALLRLLLQNLLGNAWKFTAYCTLPRIEFTREQRHGRQVFIVRDNGIGFETAQAARLFQPFTRLHAHGEFEGSGIGLTTVRRIVERHGGEVWAESRPQQGAAFYFTLAESD